MKKQKTNTPVSHNIQFRQGDVLIERIDSLPDSSTPRAPENGRVILAHGEVTGHAHEIAEPQLATLHEVGEALRLLGDTSGPITQALLTVESDTTIIHQEHSTIPLPAGHYIVRRQREYSPEAIRNVAD